MNAVTKISTASISSARFNPEQVDLIKRTICKGASDDELRLFMYQADKTGLDPLARQIYSIERREKRGDSWVSVRSIQVSIDGFRLIAERSGKYSGQRGPEWCGLDGKWIDVWLLKEPPAAARVGVLRSDFTEPCWGVARFDAYAQMKDGKPTRMWAHMPDVMLAKCAESLALRKAFPQDLAGLYTSEEMEQASEPARVLTPPPAPKAVESRPLTESEERKLDRESMREMAHETPEPPAHDPETGEVGPRALTLPKGQRGQPNWIVWGSQLIAAFQSAGSETELSEWLQANDETLTTCETDGPKVYGSVTGAYQKRYQELTGKEAHIG